MNRKARDAGAVARRCCFSDAVGMRMVGCSKAVKSTMQYRRTVRCTDSEAHKICAAWLDQVRQGARFSLGTRQPPSALPRRAARKLQGGALLGLGDLMDGPGRRVQDVPALLNRALNRHGSFDRVPLEAVIRRIHELDDDDA